ncbi:MAG TPA: type II toxin-antitoxin system YafQ family toxin [Daejeonella sp.]|nr:type II toxin-antitoxin system YafQ family toxin [Daejeonella sp.]
MGKYSLVPSGKFKKDIKKYLKKDRELKAIYRVIDILAESGHSGIPPNMKPHKLSGNYSSFWECHALSDLLIIWEQEDEPINEIYLVRVGTHSELLG